MTDIGICLVCAGLLFSISVLIAVKRRADRVRRDESTPKPPKPETHTRKPK
jgi:hypothetical protein